MRNKDLNLAQTYIRRRKRKRRAAIIAGISSLVVAFLIWLAFSLIYVDRFTITTSNDPNLCLCVDESKSKTTTSLSAPPLLNALDTQYTDIPESIDEGLGSKNTEHYFAYSFYLGGLSEHSLINYEMNLHLLDFSQELEQAVKVMVIRNGDRCIYSEGGKPLYDGIDKQEDTKREIGSTVPFHENDHIILQPYSIEPGTFDKYTVAIWIDGWESVDSMRGGTFRAELKFSTISYVD